MIPNLFISGAAKSGTTYIYDFLNIQKNVHMSPIKEPHFFSKEISKIFFNPTSNKRNNFDIEKYLKANRLQKKHIAYIDNMNHYLQLFRENAGATIVGEASTGYLYSTMASKEIYKFNPNSKIIIVLRDPVERCLSHWLMDYRLGLSRSDKCFDDIIYDFSLKDNTWRGKSHTYIQIGLYFEQIKRFLDIFPKKQVKILLFEDLKKNQDSFEDDLCDFLCLDKKNKVSMNKKSNKGKVPKNRISNLIFKISKEASFIKNFFPLKFRNKIMSLLLTENFSKKNYLSNKEKKYLFTFFEDDIKKVESLISRDLSIWSH